MSPAGQVVRRPLVGIALAVAAGLASQRALAIAPLPALGSAGLALAGGLWFFRRAASAPILYLACGLLACAHGALAVRPPAERALLLAAEAQRDPAVWSGTVAEEPYVAGSGRLAFLFHPDTVRFGGSDYSCRTSVRVYFDGDSAPIRCGERWRFPGRLTVYEQPRGGAAGVLRADSSGGLKRLAAAPGGVRAFSVRLRQRAARLLRDGIEPFPVQTGLLHAMLLGYRQALPESLYRIFSRTGTLHIFAISGQHVVLLAAICIASLKAAGLSRPRWGLVLIPALTLYIFSTGLQPSALRALVMGAVYFAAPLAGRRPDALSAVALSAVLLLAADPPDISDPGFILSFAVVCGLILVHGWARERAERLRRTRWDAALTRLQGGGAPARLLRGTGLLLLSSLAAWLFSVPASAVFFHNVAFAGLIGNVAVVPLTFLVMLAGCLAVAAGAVWEPAAALFNQANLLFVDLMWWAVGKMAEWPGACRAVQPPPTAVLWLWYAGLVLFFSGPARWRKWGPAAVVAAGVIWGAAHIATGDSLRLVRDGRSSVAVQLPGGGWTVAVNTTGSGAADALRMVQRESIGQVERLLVSGADPRAAERLEAGLTAKRIETTEDRGSMVLRRNAAGRLCLDAME